MLSMDDTAVITDFSSCRKQGEKGFMAGTHMSTDANCNENCTDFENDQCDLTEIREWLHDPAPFTTSMRSST